MKIEVDEQILESLRGEYEDLRKYHKLFPEAQARFNILRVVFELLIVQSSKDGSVMIEN